MKDEDQLDNSERVIMHTKTENSIVSAKAFDID